MLRDTDPTTSNKRPALRIGAGIAAVALLLGGCKEPGASASGPVDAPATTETSAPATPGEATPSQGETQVAPETNTSSIDVTLESSDYYNSLSSENRALVEDAFEDSSVEKNAALSFDERIIIGAALADAYRQAFIDSFGEGNEGEAKLYLEDYSVVPFEDIAEHPGYPMNNLQVKIATAFAMAEIVKAHRDEYDPTDANNKYTKLMQRAISILNGCFENVVESYEPEGGGAIDYSQDPVYKKYAALLEQLNGVVDGSAEPFRVWDGTLGHYPEYGEAPVEGVDYWTTTYKEDIRTDDDSVLMNMPHKDVDGNCMYVLATPGKLLGQGFDSYAISTIHDYPATR